MEQLSFVCVVLFCNFARYKMKLAEKAES